MIGELADLIVAMDAYQRTGLAGVAIAALMWLAQPVDSWIHRGADAWPTERADAIESGDDR